MSRNAAEAAPYYVRNATGVKPPDRWAEEYKVTMSDEKHDAAPSLADEQRRLTQRRILEGARTVIAKEGFDATVEEIAEAAGVSPRTVFRQFLTRDKLLEAAIVDMYETLSAPIEGPDPAVDLDGWLLAFLRAAHVRNREILGNAFWELHWPKKNSPEVVENVRGLRQRYRKIWMDWLAAEAWKAAGGTGERPELLVRAFSFYTSGFTTRSLDVDCGFDADASATFCARMLKFLIVDLVAQEAAPA